MKLLTGFMLLMLNLPMAFAGNESAKGGHPLLGEFVARSNYILAKVRYLDGPDKILSDEDIGKFEVMLDPKHSRMILTDEKLEDQGGMVATLVTDDPQFPDSERKLFKINITEWRDALQKDANYVNRFVFHEWLRAIGRGEDDNTYQISSKLDLLTFASPEGLQKITINELIMGDYEPVDKTDQDVLNQGEVNSVDSYLKAREKFRETVPSQVLEKVKAHFKVLHHEVKVADQERAKDTFWDYVDDPNYYRGQGRLNAQTTGFLTRAYARLTFQTDTRQSVDVINKIPINGNVVSFSLKGGLPFIHGAQKMAIASHQKSCETWQKKQKEIYEERLLYAECVDPTASKPIFFNAWFEKSSNPYEDIGNSDYFYGFFRDRALSRLRHVQMSSQGRILLIAKWK